MAKLHANAQLLEDCSNQLGKDVEKLRSLADDLLENIKSLRANPALCALEYDDKTDAARSALIAYTEDIVACAEAMQVAGISYHDAEIFALGALEGKTPEQALFGEDTTTVDADYQPEMSHRFNFGVGYLDVKAGGVLNEVLFGGIRDFVYDMKGIPPDAYKHWDPLETLGNYFADNADASGGVGNVDENGVRTVGGHAQAKGTFWSSGFELGLGTERNNIHGGFNMSVGNANAEGGVVVDSKGNTYAGWNAGVNAVDGEGVFGITIDNVRGDLSADANAGGVGSEFNASGNADEGRISFGLGLELLMGIGLHGNVQDLDRVKK